MRSSNDRVRSIAVAVTAVTQVLSFPVTSLLLGSSADTGAISNANASPVTPAGYAFTIWGLIYLGSLALATYQLLPAQLHRDVHRRTGWWLAAAFACSTAWVPIFGSRAISPSQVVILVLVGCLAKATGLLTRSGAAATNAERWLLRLPTTLYLGWATLAAFAGFGTTLRSLGMPARAGWVTWLSVALLLVAAAVATAVVSRETAMGGFAVASCWALLAVAAATYEEPVRVVAWLGLATVALALLLHAVRSRRVLVVLLG